MKRHRPLIILTLFTLALAGCSKHSPDTSSTPKTSSATQVGTYHERLANIITRSTNAAPQTDDKDAVLPGRHMSERQVMEVATRQLPQRSVYRCEFKDGVWEILEVQKDVWGVSSRTTNADGKLTIQSTNATRVVLRVRDADGKVEPIEIP